MASTPWKSKARPRPVVTPKGANPPSDDQLEGVAPGGKVPESRLRDPQALHNIYTRLKNADLDSSRNRAMVDAMFDGEPPYDDAELAAAGQSQRTNLDFGEGAAALEAALTGYYDLTNSVDVISRLVTTYGEDANERAEWEAAMSEEFHRLQKDWPEFESLFQRTCSEFVKHGVSIAFHPTDTNWQFDTSGWSGFRIPRTTKASENQIEIAIAERKFQLHELYAFIKNPKFAAGWDVNEVRKALVNAGRDEKSKNYLRDWEALQQNLKNNDLGHSASSTVRVPVIHAWVREFDGTVSHYISLESGENKKFLFTRPSRFKSMSQCFTIFTYGVGNGYYHSIRGLGYKLFPIIQVANRLRGQGVDGAMFGSSVMLQAMDEKALQNLELTYVGPYAILPKGFNVVERALPNVATQVLPVINDLSLLMQNNVGTYRARQITSDGQEETATGVKARVEREATLSVAAMNLFYLPWGRLQTSMALRVCSGKLSVTDPGGREAKDFEDRCLARGVPIEAIRGVVRAEPTRAIGYGSAAMRSVAFDEMLQVAGSLDEIGQRRILRDKFASKLGGYHNVDAYIPKLSSVARQPVDADIANLENAAMHGGTEVPVRDGQNHPTHVGVHLPDIVQAADLLDASQQAPEPQPGDLEALQTALGFLQIAVPHTAHHVEAMSSDKLHEEQVAQIKKALQEIDAKAQGAMANLQKMMEAKAQEAQQQGGQPAAPDPKVLRMIDEWNVKKSIMLQDHDLKSQLKVEDKKQQMAIRDAQSAQKMRTQREKENIAFPGASVPRAKAPRK